MKTTTTRLINSDCTFKGFINEKCPNLKLINLKLNLADNFDENATKFVLRNLDQNVTLIQTIIANMRGQSIIIVSPKQPKFFAEIANEKGEKSLFITDKRELAICSVINEQEIKLYICKLQ